MSIEKNLVSMDGFRSIVRCRLLVLSISGSQEFDSLSLEADLITLSYFLTTDTVASIALISSVLIREKPCS